MRVESYGKALWGSYKALSTIMNRKSPDNRAFAFSSYSCVDEGIQVTGENIVVAFEAQCVYLINCGR